MNTVKTGPTMIPQHLVTESNLDGSKRTTRPIELRAFQTAIGLFGLIPIGAGLSGMIRGTEMIETQAISLSLDSQYRYLSGLLLAIGLAYWSMIPTISKRSRDFQILTAIVFAGGLGRLIGIIIRGFPSTQMLLGLMMELVITPLALSLAVPACPSD